MKYCLHNCKLKTKHTGFFHSLSHSDCCSGSHSSSFFCILSSHSVVGFRFLFKPFYPHFIVHCIRSLLFGTLFHIIFFFYPSLVYVCLMLSAPWFYILLVFLTMGNTLVKIIYSLQYITKSEKEWLLLLVGLCAVYSSFFSFNSFWLLK